MRTNQMRNGDFSQWLAQKTPIAIKDPVNGQPFANNIIPASRISSVAQAVNQTYLPAPNRGGPDSLGSNYGFTFPFPQDYHLREDFTQRIDYQISSKNPLRGRVIEDWGASRLPTNH